MVVGDVTMEGQAEGTSLAETEPFGDLNLQNCYLSNGTFTILILHVKVLTTTADEGCTCISQVLLSGQIQIAAERLKRAGPA